MVYVVLKQMGSMFKPFIFGYACNPDAGVKRQIDAYKNFILGTIAILNQEEQT